MGFPPRLVICISSEPSNIKHIEEIKEAGYEIPSVNQIEVVDFLLL